MKPGLTIVTALLLAVPALAESRSVLVVVTHDKDGKARAAVHSDDKQDRRAAGPVEEACKALSGARGKGSVVSVYVVTDRPMAKQDRTALFAAIDDSVLLELSYDGPYGPRHLADHFLGSPPADDPGKGDNKGAKPALVVDRADPPQRDGNAHHVVFAGSGGGPVHRAGPEHFKLVRVSDGKRVALAAAYDRTDLEPEVRGEKRARPTKPARSEYSYGYQFRGVAFSLTSGSYDAKDASQAEGLLPPYGRAELEAGVKYRLTWACWPVGAREAVDVSCEFEVGK